MRTTSGQQIVRLILIGALATLAPAWMAAQQMNPQQANPERDRAVLGVSEPVLMASLALPSAPVPNVGGGASPAAVVGVMPVVAVKAPTELPQEHRRFWDNENRILFVAAGGMATADFFVTRSNLVDGGKELNPVTRIFAGSTPALACNFALEEAGVIGVSYMFHKTGHHKLERMTSFVNISASAGAVAYSASHR